MHSGGKSFGPNYSAKSNLNQLAIACEIWFSVNFMRGKPCHEQDAYLCVYTCVSSASSDCE